ncbi:MAG: LysM peptidoglycan-binding domain-containing protein, partial [Flavobacteriales bacterium]
MNRGTPLLTLLLFALLIYSTQTGVAQDRFGLDSAHVKATNNKGEGQELLWGTRNMRVVLKNILYRGGGNNFHYKPTQPKGYIMNPLPITGIYNLQKAGFGSAWYLYAKNFDTLYTQQRLDSLKLAGFSYECHPNLTEDVVSQFLKDIHQSILSPNTKPMYIHCWNGWHQSGMLSAFTLMQFCGLNNQQALKYWEQNTDNNYKGYSSVKTRILEFKPDSNLMISKDTQLKICPCFTEDVLNVKVKKSVKDVKSEGESGSEKNMEEKKKNESNSTYHTVKAGDTLSEIALKYDTTLKKLCELNGMKQDKILRV